MKKDTIFLEMSDSSQVAIHRWIPDGEIKALIQISHGMAEHALRYDYVASQFVDKGFVVYAHDHRGHGETAGSKENFGYLADIDGFERVVLDLREVITQLKQDFPAKKVFLLGHSFGSFIAQSFIQQFAYDIDGCILSGSAGPRGIIVDLGRLVASLVVLVKGKKYQSLLLHNLAFGSYNKHIENPVSSNAWLSRDVEIVKQYDEHEYDGFICTAGFFKDLFTGLSIIHKKKSIQSIPDTLPIFLFAGTHDPVGDYGKTVAHLAKIYQKKGIEQVSLILYPEGRHEMLNEINKDEVIENILIWIKKFI